MPDLPDASPLDPAAGDIAVSGDADPAQTAPDPDSPLRTDAPTLPPEAVGTATDRVIEGHTYDGIREYDNPMPGWWVGLFWAGILFAPVYMLGIHVFGFVDTYEDDFAESGERLDAVRELYAATGPAFKTDAGALREYVQDAGMASAGEANFQAICAACHGNAGQGTVGPNLTDAYWIHGADPEALWASISQGFPAKGMPPMDAMLGEQERAEVMAYIVSLQGTDPPNAKAPEGELVAGL